MYLGLDIGSSSSKAVLLGENQESLAAQVVNLGTAPRVWAGAGGSLSPGGDWARRGSLYGGNRLWTYDLPGGGSANYGDQRHAKGVFHLSSSARTIVDVGGQDTKVIRLGQDGSVENFVMNDKCAAGTGRFLEVMARVLDCPIGLPLPAGPNRERKWFPSAISARYSLNQRSSPTSPRCVPGQCGGGCHRIHCHTGSPGWLGVSGWSRRWL